MYEVKQIFEWVVLEGILRLILIVEQFKSHFLDQKNEYAKEV